MTDKQFNKIRAEYTRILGYELNGLFLDAGWWSPAERIVALRQIPNGAGQAAIRAAMKPLILGQTLRRFWREVLSEEADA